MSGSSLLHTAGLPPLLYWSFQETSGKLKPPTRTRRNDYETSARHLSNSSSAASSWLGGLEQTPTRNFALLAFPSWFSPTGTQTYHHSLSSAQNKHSLMYRVPAASASSPIPSGELITIIAALQPTSHPSTFLWGTLCRDFPAAQWLPVPPVCDWLCMHWCRSTSAGLLIPPPALLPHGPSLVRLALSPSSFRGSLRPSQITTANPWARILYPFYPFSESHLSPTSLVPYEPTHDWKSQNATNGTSL